MKKFISLILMLLTLAVGQMWATADHEKTDSWDFSTSGNDAWSSTNCGSYCGGWGKNKNAAPSVSKSNISDFSSVNFSNHENVSLTIYVTAAHNSGTNSYTVTLIDSNGNKVSNYQLTKTDGMGSGSNAGSARESSLTFTPTQAFSGYKIEFYPKSFITQTRYVLTYDDKSISCSTPPTVGTNLTSVSATANSIIATVPISAIGGCNITENGLVYSTTNSAPTVGGTGCTKVTTTACGSTAANKTVTITGLSCGTTYYVRGYATNAAGTQYTTNTKTQATSDCPVDHFIDEVQSTTGYTGDGMAKAGDYSASLPSIADKSVATTGNCQALHYHFVGWVLSDYKDSPTGHIATLNGHATGATYYAVWAKKGTGSSPSTISIDATGLQAVVSDITSGYSQKTITIGGYNCTASAVTKSTQTGTSGWLQLKKNNDYILIPELPGAITNISSSSIKNASNSSVSTGVYFNSSATTSQAIASETLSNATSFSLDITGTATSGYFLVGAATCINQLSITYSTIAYEDYITTCCTELGSINGTVSVSQTSAVVKLASAYSDASNADAYQLKVEGSSNYNTWTDVDKDDLTTSVGVTVNGLACGTDYTAYLRAKGSGTYCDYGTESHVDFTTSKYSIEKANSGNVKDGEENTIGTFAVTGNPTEACNPSTISLTYTITDNTYQFKAWNVHKKNDASTTVSVTSNQFSMPAYDVVVDLELEKKSSPTLTPSTDAVNFGNQEISTTSSAETITISGSNLQGNVAFEIIGTDASAFAVTSPASSPIAQANAAAVGGQSVQITFTPSSAKVHSATLRFTSTNATTRDVTLSGTGINLYTVTLNVEGGNGLVSTTGWSNPSTGVYTKKQTSLDEAISLPNATLSTTLSNGGWSFEGWKTDAVSTQTDAAQTCENASYTPAGDITLHAVYKFTEIGEDYQLVEADRGTAWAGDYLIAYSDALFADGRVGGTDGLGKQNTEVDPDENLSENKKVVAASWGDTYNVTLEEISENSNTYVLKTKDGKYNYQTSNANGLAATDNKNTAADYPITVTFTSSSDVKLGLGGAAAGAVFRYNTGGYFRFYKDCGQSAVYLYRKGAESYSYYSNPSTTVTLTYNGNGQASEASTVPSPISYTMGNTATVVAKPNDMVKTGYSFVGWNTKQDGTGDNYVKGSAKESFTINKNTTLYAKWSKNNYTVAVASVDHTAITATPEGSSAITESANASVAYGTVVTLGKTNDTHFTFDEWDVYETNNSSNKVTVTETAGVYTFTVPDFNVTVSATAPIEDHKNTVIWHVNYETSETANVYDGTPFSQLSAPAVADNAVSTCANKFMGWATAAVSKDNATSSDVEWADATNVSSTNKDFYAVWATGSGSESETTFTRITNAADFVEGQKIIIVSNANAHMLGNDFTGGDEPTETNGEITVSDNKYVWTIGEIDNNGWFQLSSGDVYLSTAAGVTSSAKYQAVTNNTNEYSWWSIDDQLSTTNCFALLNDGGSTDSDEDWEWISYLEWYNSNSQWQSYYVTNFGTETYFALRFYKPKTITNYSNYITNCCLPVENTLTITNANQVATGNTLTLSSTGGNGGTVVWTVEAGTGTATISEGVLTGGNLGTVTLKAHQNEYNNYCAQDAEDMTVEIVAATVPVTSVSLNHTTAALLPGETIQLNATLTPGNATDQTIGWVSGTPAKATVSNAGLVTAVAKGTSTVTATANGGDNVTATCAVTVHGLTILKQDETGATISVEGVTASATGKALTASAGETQYVFKGWKYAENGNGGLDAIANASNTSITLTGTPTGDVTIIAEFYKPVTITWLVDGEDAAAGSQTLSVARGTLWSALTPAAEPAGNALGSCATAFVGWSNSMNDELRGNGNPAPAVLFRNAQISSYDTEITDPITFRAVFATSAAGSTFDGEHGGTYKIYALIGETKYYANGTGSKINNTTDVSLATNYTIEVVTGGFAIKTGDNYITYSSSTNLGTSTDPYTWTVASGTKGTWRLNSGTSGRGWIYRAGTTNQFGGYATNNVTAAGTEYYDLEIGNDASYSNYVTVCCTPHAITVTGNDDSENKTVSADATEICDGMTVNLSRSTSCTHYTFNEWVVKYTDGESVDHTINVPEATASFTMPAYDVTVEGDWSPVNYKVTIASAANGTATVKEGYATDENGKWIVPYGETVTLQAAPNDAEAYYFSGWTLSPDKDVQKSQAELPITMTGSFTATPSFAPVVYSALTLDGTEGVYSLSATLANGDPIPNMSSIKSGTALKVTYALSGQNEYVGWTFSVNSVEKTAEGTTVTFNMPEEALNVSLNTRPYYMLNLSAEHGSITGVSINSEAQALAAQYIVHEGEVVALTAAPADDTYKFKEWTGATVSNGQFTVGTEDLDVVAVFELKTTYTLTLMALGSEQEKIEGILEGESIWEQIEDKEAPEITGQLFLGWSLLEDDKDMIISESEDLDIDDNYPLYAVYQAMTPCYVKVTSTSDIKNGKYLIVYETGGLAFNGGLETLDATSNTIGVEINTTGDYKTIAISENTTAAEFTIASLDGGGYSIKSASGKYIDRTSGTSGGGFNTTESNPKAHTLSIDNDGNFADKASASTASYLKYNSSSGQYRFRYYTSGQQAIQLYKRAGIPNDAGETASIPTVTITTPVNADEIYPDGKAGNIVVEAGGKLNVSDNLNVNNIFIESEACASGQVIGATNLHGDLYMDVTFFKGATTLNETTAGRWYMISAPFDVNLNDGFTLTDGTAMHFGVDDNALTFDLFEYDGTKRATTGVTGWKRVQGKMKAGTACLIGFNPGQPTTIRLKAASTTLTEKTSITLQAFDGDATNQNWNGVANPTLHYTNIDQNVQVYENEDGEHGRKYNVYSASTYSFVVGTAFFVQATGSIGLEAASHSQFRAPKRESERYEACVQIFRQEATEFADQMYVRASETASNEYEQGHDMITWNGTTGNTAMIWAENYGKRLAIEEAPLVSNQASYVLGIFAPKAGTYRIAATSEDDADLYLTYEGAIIWNLSMGAYEIELNKGTTDGYGLLLQKKAPQTPTGVDEVDAKTGVQKIIINDNVFILRGGQMYDVTGKAVK